MAVAGTVSCLLVRGSAPRDRRALARVTRAVASRARGRDRPGDCGCVASIPAPWVFREHARGGNCRSKPVESSRGVRAPTWTGPRAHEPAGGSGARCARGDGPAFRSLARATEVRYVVSSRQEVPGLDGLLAEQ